MRMMSLGPTRVNAWRPTGVQHGFNGRRIANLPGRQIAKSQPDAFTSQPRQTPQEEEKVLAIKDIVQFLGTAAGGSALAYAIHPTLLQLVANTWDLQKEGDGSFETSFFGLVGIVYGLIAGNTFLFLYERQVNIVQELYGEVFALELVLQQEFLAVPDPESRKELAARVRSYIGEELFNPIDMVSPFYPNSAFCRLTKQVCKQKDDGYDVTGLAAAMQKLADAQSRRSAVAASVLPNIHWIFLYALQFIFVVCFLVFSAASNDGESAINAERRLAFGSLVGVLVLTQQVLYDLDNPIEGLYSFRSSLQGRLSYVTRLLSELEKNPAPSFGWVPVELERLNKLGILGAYTTDEISPSTAMPLNKGRKGRVDDGSSSYVGGPLHTLEGSWEVAAAEVVMAQSPNGAASGSSGKNGQA